jgi:hypothetical protein
MRWLSRMFTSPRAAALEIAMLIQATSISTYLVRITQVYTITGSDKTRF